MIEAQLFLDSPATSCPARPTDLDRAIRLRVNTDATAREACPGGADRDMMSTLALQGIRPRAITRNRRRTIIRNSSSHLLTPSVSARNVSVTKTQERS
jgi:hypothetical protein